MKQRALQLLLEGWDMDDIVESLGVSTKSITRWKDNYEQHGTVSPTSVTRGRRRLLTSTMLGDLKALILDSPSLYLDELSKWLAIYHDQPISTSALCQNLLDAGLTYKLLQKAAAEQDNQAREGWLHDVLMNFAADQLIFLDESSKDNRTVFRRYGCAMAGERAIEVVPLDRGVRYSILPALTLDGYLAVRVVEGSIDGAEYYDFVLKEVVSVSHTSYISSNICQLPVANRFPGNRSILVMDNCSTHKSEALRLAVEAAGMCRLIQLMCVDPSCRLCPIVLTAIFA
jgi:transposase